MYSICHISYYFSERFKFSTRLQWWKVWDVCYFTQKSGNIWKHFCSKNGGRAQGPAQARGACPPFLGKKAFFEWSSFPFSAKQQNALAFPNRSWVIHLIESVSRMLWILSNGMHARSLTHWCESNNTEHSLDFWNYLFYCTNYPILIDFLLFFIREKTWDSLFLDKKKFAVFWPYLTLKKRNVLFCVF